MNENPMRVRDAKVHLAGLVRLIAAVFRSLQKVVVFQDLVDLESCIEDVPLAPEIEDFGTTFDQALENQVMRTVSHDAEKAVPDLEDLAFVSLECSSLLDSTETSQGVGCNCANTVFSNNSDYGHGYCGFVFTFRNGDPQRSPFR